MAEICTENKLLQFSHGWPGEPTVCTLANRASGLFIWASTACKFIDGHDPEQRLRILLQTNSSFDAEASLDALYATALQSANPGKWQDAAFGADFRAIVGTIVVARDPLSADAIDKLLVLDGKRPTVHAIAQLGCVLHSNSFIRILHPSFADFLSNRCRCKCDHWFIDIALHNLRIAVQCLDRLDSFLRYNVCNLNLSMTADGAYLPEDIAYACSFWVEHVCMVDEHSSIVSKLEGFLFKHLLHWFEAMSILKKARETTGMMIRLLDWLGVSNRLLPNIMYD
jgi:hypothetical protein